VALRQLLADLAESSGAADPAALAGQLLVLVDGAVAVAVVDRRPEAATWAGRLASALLEQGVGAGTAAPAAGAAFCRGRRDGVAGETVAATTALTPRRRRP
jgi:hypothetical protein